jgi:transposase-like protein
MTNPTRTRRRFTAQQKEEAVELCLQEGLSCNAVAERLGLPSSSLARWWGSPGFVDTDQGVTAVSVRAAMNCCS